MLDRRSFVGLLGATGAVLALGGCGGDAPSAAPAPEPVVEPAQMRVVALKGPTAMGLVRLMSESEAGDVTDVSCTFELKASPDEVVPLLAKGEVDVAAIPSNLASVLYNKTQGGVRVICVNTLGVLYVVGHGSGVSRVADLAGRTVYAAGKGATPEYALAYVLAANGLAMGDDVDVQWCSEHAECVAALAKDPEALALLPQPFVTTAQMKDGSLGVVLDLNEEWRAAASASGQGGSLVTGVAVVRSEYADEHPDAVGALLAHYRESVDYVASDVAGAARLVDDYGIVPEAVAERALPECNIVCQTGAEMRDGLEGYLQALFDQNPQAVGGAMPGDDFYYGA